MFTQAVKRINKAMFPVFLLTKLAMRITQGTVNLCPASIVTAVLAVVSLYDPSRAFAAPNAGPTAATQENHKVMEIVSKGLDEAFDKSVTRDLEIGKKLQEIIKEQLAMLEALH